MSAGVWLKDKGEAVPSEVAPALADEFHVFERLPNGLRYVISISREVERLRRSAGSGAKLA